jgi:hypothetical protein
MHFVGGVAGVLAMSAMPARISNRLLLGASYALMVAGGSASRCWAPSAAGLAVTGWLVRATGASTSTRT